MSRSIIQNKEDHYCYLCSLLDGRAWQVAVLEEHHIMYGIRWRKKSERFGLKIYLCPEHHRTGKMAVHRDKDVRILTEQVAQYAFEKKYSHEKWMQEFGKNFLP